MGLNFFFILEFENLFEVSFSILYSLKIHKKTISAFLGLSNFIVLPPGRHHEHRHSFVRECNLHIKHGKQKKEKKNSLNIHQRFFASSSYTIGIKEYSTELEI